MRHPIAVLLLAMVPLLEPSNASALRRDQKPTRSDIQIAPPREPGERLIVTGRVVSKDDRKPVPGATVYVYHADVRGRYTDVAGLEPRLCGVLLTNQKGDYTIRTVMPGAYSGAPPHIHFEVWGRNVLKKHLFVNLDLRTAVPTPKKSVVPPVATGSYDDRSSMSRPVRRGEDGVLTCTYDLVVETVDGSLPVLPLPRRK